MDFKEILDAWEKKASALEVQLTQTKAEAIERVETQKTRVKESLDRFNAAVEKAKELPKETRLKIQNQIEHLQVQLALGKADAKDAYQAQKKKITQAIASFEADVDRDLQEAFEPLAQELLEESIALEAELDAAELQFEVKKAEKKTTFETKKQELAAKIQAYKEKVKTKRQMKQEKFEALDQELSAEFARLMDGVTKVFSDM